MNFTSLLFLYLFLPAVLLIHSVMPKKFRNAFLLTASLIFYIWGARTLIWVLAVSITVNYIFGILIGKAAEKRALKKLYVFLAVFIDIGMLIAFKYLGFFSDIAGMLPWFSEVPKFSLAMPIGISFYTFGAISYIVDVYRGSIVAEKNIVNFGTYVSLFPKVVSGPIVRYADIAHNIKNRDITAAQFSSGIMRFVTGLAKKVLIADNMLVFWNTMKAMPEAGIAASWLGIIAFTLQIYFDFSGYSDMAIGIGRMLGFDFKENFNYPYVSKSLTEFWRRWHISLSSWFRDYIYIPLGGNRVKVPRHVINLFIVWFLTGFWHGASVNYILWGLYYFVMLVCEKYIYGKALKKAPSVLQHIYALLFIVLGWVLFSFENFTEMSAYITRMFTVTAGICSHDALSTVISYIPLFAAAIFFSLPITRNLYRKTKKNPLVWAAEIIAIILFMALATAQIVNGGYTTFLYFKF